MSRLSDLEDDLAFQLRAAGLPLAEREYRFDPVRRWRFDFAWPEMRVAVEVQGAIYVKGKHSTGRGIEKDHEKANAAVLAGWKVLQYSRVPIESGEALRQIEALVRPGGLANALAKVELKP